MKLARRFMVFLTGCACFVFSSDQSGILGEANAKVVCPIRAPGGPIGVISDLVYKVNGVAKTPDQNNQISFTQPNSLYTGATCEVEVPGGYQPGAVQFYCDWKLDGPNSGNSDYWNPLLNPGASDSRFGVALITGATGNWTSSVIISYTDSIQTTKRALSSEVTTFVGQ